MRIKKQFDHVGQCLEELSSMGIEAPSSVLSEAYNYYVSEKLAFYLKKEIPGIIIDFNSVSGPFIGTFKKSGATVDLQFFMGDDFMNAPIDINVHIWPPKGYKFLREEDGAAVPDKLCSLFPELSFRKWEATIGQDVFFEAVPGIFKTILRYEELFFGKDNSLLAKS